MSNADRIEELRIKYEENPRRYFAPLANEFRKAGDLAQAIAICREHLPKQPGHMSGYIVFGQTLYEANNLEEARSVFEQALALDPENLIALKHLGDIARINGENSVARRWYARVLDADPRNDDIASQLASLGPPTPAIAVPVVVQVSAPTPEPELEEKPGVFATFDPSSLLDLHVDVADIFGTPVDLHAEANDASDAMGHPTGAASDAPHLASADEFAERAVQEARFDARHEPLDLDFPDDPEPAADEEFEEGILAPEWPDTSELVARIVTPLRSATPLSVPATVEAVEAFGRETSDPVEPAFVDTPLSDELVEAFLPVDAARRLDAEPVEEDLDTQVTTEFAIPGHWTSDEPVDSPVAEENEALWEVPDFVDEPVAEVLPVHAFDMIDDFSAEPASEIAEHFAIEPAGEIAEPVAVESAGERAEPVAIESDGELASESTDQIVAEPGTIAVPEESYAELSSELETERVEAEEEADTSPTFVTETMAELLVSQGFVSRAIAVYDELVRRRPYDAPLAARLQELRTTEHEELRRADELLAQQRAFETPAIASPLITPLYSTPLRATPVFTPHASNSGQFNAQVNAQQAFRTARERFAELASRRVARRTPSHATAIADDPTDGLSALFGTSQPTTTDELAARALADAFGPVQDSGESLFDPVAMPTPAAPLRALTPRHSPTVHAPVQTNPDQRSDRQPASDYSFDKFFPDPAMTNRDAPTVHSSVSGAPDSSQPVNEDLAQFSAWLKGLNNA